MFFLSRLPAQLPEEKGTSQHSFMTNLNGEKMPNHWVFIEQTLGNSVE